MARFTFTLQAVLTQRKHVEHQRQRELAVVEAQMTALQNQLRAINDAIKQAGNDLREHHLVGKLDMSYLAAHRRFSIAMQRSAMTFVQKIALAQRQADEARTRLADAAKQRKAIERLREKQHQRWHEQQQRKELAELDEIGMQLAYALPAGGGEP